MITSDNPQFYSDGKKTGLFWAEAWHPYNVYSKAGFGVDVASETGTFGFDEHSIQDDVMDEESKTAWHDPSNPLKKLLDKSLLKASDVDPSKYGIFFAAGGHGAVFDFPSARGLHEIASKIYAADGVVAAVCHGPAILPGIKDPVTGESLVKDRKVTGFTAEGERLFQVEETMKKLGVHTVEELVTQAGGIYAQVQHWVFVPSRGEGGHKCGKQGDTMGQCMI